MAEGAERAEGAEEDRENEGGDGDEGDRCALSLRSLVQKYKPVTATLRDQHHCGSCCSYLLSSPIYHNKKQAQKLVQVDTLDLSL